MIMEALPTAINTAPSTSPLTAWEAKERAGLLALETDEWREKRLIAEAPNTTADVLERLAFEALDARRKASRRSPHSVLKREDWKQGDLLLEALAAHPNTPPHLFRRLISVTVFSAKAFCGNPVTPFLLLEQPDFLRSFGLFKLTELFAQSDVPVVFLRTVVQGNATKIQYVQETARLHVALAGEVSAADEWRRYITDYWKSECALATHESEDILNRQWHADLVEMALAPTWANGTIGPPSPEAAAYDPDTTDAVVDEWLRFDHSPGSDEEAALLNRIGKRVADKELVARGLRQNATPADMIELLQAPGGGTVLLCRILLHHPFVQADVLQAMPSAASWHGQQWMVKHPNVPTEVVTRLCQSEHPNIRRLARRHPNAPADAVAISRAAFLDHVRQHIGDGPTPFGFFIACLQGATRPTDLQTATKIGSWTHRLGYVLQVEVTDEPMAGDFYARTGRELLEHLSRDGNRLVRWAAQTRLADPDFVFQF